MGLDEQAYKKVIEKIIARQVELVGTLAVSKAKSVIGLEIDDQGKVMAISGAPLLIIHNLLLKYEEVAGKVATMVSKIAITGLKKEYPGLELPPKLM